MDVRNCSALVTGGAGLLGSVTVRALAGAGASVVVLDREPDAAAEALDGLGGVVVVGGDVTDVGDARRAAEAAADHGPLRVVVNCAGIGTTRRTLDREGRVHDLDSFRQLLEVNVVGTFNVLGQAARVMAAAEPYGDAGGRGVVVTTASLAGLEGSAGQVAYATSKAAVAGMTLPAARDLGVVGIRVVGIAPGGMAQDTAPWAEYPEVRRQLDQTPWPRRFGLPEEYAALVMSIVGNDYLNGSVIRLDGGARLPLK